MGKLQGRRFLVVIAHEMFRDEEYEVPREIIEAEGGEITVASTALSPARGKLGLEVKPDVLLRDVSPADYDAVIFVGGAGCKSYWNDEQAHAVAAAFAGSGKLTAAICSAPVILGNAGILKGRKATCFADDREELEKGGAEYTSRDVEVDGMVVTANGYRASSDFANTIIAQLQ